MAELEAKVRALECWARREITVKPLSEAGIEGVGEGRTNHNFVVTVTHHDGAERKFFVRLGDDLPAYGVSRKREEGAMCVAAAQGGVPRKASTAPPSATLTYCPTTLWSSRRGRWSRRTSRSSTLNTPTAARR